MGARSRTHLLAYRPDNPVSAQALEKVVIVAFGAGSHWQPAVLALVWSVVALGFSLAVIDLFRQAGGWSDRRVRALGRVLPH